MVYYSGKLVRVPFALYGLPNQTRVPPAGELSGSDRATRCPTEERGRAYGAGCPLAFKPRTVAWNVCWPSRFRGCGPAHPHPPL